MAGKHTTRNGDPEIARLKQEQREQLAAKRREVKENNPVYQERLEALQHLIPEGAQKVDLSFPPYWKAEEMTGFYGRLLKRDERDVKPDGSVFVRYHWQNLGPAMDCRRGAVDDGIIETVPTGRIFTTGDFKGLPLAKWFGFNVTVICKEMRTLPGNAASEYVERDFWEFEAHLMPQDIKIIESREVADMEFVIAAQREADRMAVQEMARLNSAERLGLHLRQTSAAKVA